MAQSPKRPFFKNVVNKTKRNVFETISCLFLHLPRIAYRRAFRMFARMRRGSRVKECFFFFFFFFSDFCLLLNRFHMLRLFAAMAGWGERSVERLFTVCWITAASATAAALNVQSAAQRYYFCPPRRQQRHWAIDDESKWPDKGAGLTKCVLNFCLQPF